MWILGLWEKIRKLFNREKSITTDTEQRENSNNTARYEDISDINFTAIIANKLATLATAESDIAIEADNKRAVILGDTLASVWRKIKKITSMSLGTGGSLIVPYVQSGKILFDIVSQDRLGINAKNGDLITSATVLADTVTVGDITYYRWVDYTIENGSLLISNKVTTETGSPASLSQWDFLQDISIANVDRVPFGFIKSPVDNRKTADNYGVPITYGCDRIIGEIIECLGQIKEEFELKEVRIMADERMFAKDKNGKPILKSKVFFAAKNPLNEASMFNIFDPGIRESSYYSRLMNLFELLEKEIGTSKGILTAPETRGATATEIKAGMYDTYAVITDIREAIEKGINDFLYACDVLANYYGLSPAGKYECRFDWSYSMIESSAETWQQMKDGQSIGIRSKAELRAWQTGEDPETAQKAIDEITAKEPNLSSLVGMSE